MRGILLRYWLSFLATSLSMSRHNDCNFMKQVIQYSQDFQICVCSNQVYVNCTLNGQNGATNNLTKKEEICYKRLVKLANASEQKTCVCSRLNQCHSEEQLALHKVTCVRKAVMKMNPIRSQLKTLCCDLQSALLKLWFRLEERVFLSGLIKSISHDSLQRIIISRRLRRTKWCKAFHMECLEVDSFIRKGCKVRHRKRKRDIKEPYRSYKREFVPFSTVTTKRLQEHTKQSGAQSTIADVTTTTRTQATRVSEAFSARTWVLKSTATTGNDEERNTLSMSVYWPRLPTPSSSSSSSSLSSSSSVSLSSSISSSSSSSSSQRKSSRGLLSSTSSSSPSHLTKNLNPLQNYAKPSTATREQTSNTAEPQTNLLSSTNMASFFKDRMTRLMVARSTSLPSVAISTVVSPSKVTSSLTSSATSKAQLDDSPSRWYSSISSSTLRIESSPLPPYTSSSTSTSSSLSPTPRHWSLGITTRSPEPSNGQEVSSRESTAEAVSTAVLTKEPSFSKYLRNEDKDGTPVKETSTHLVSKTEALTPSIVDYESTKTSDSSHFRTLTPVLHSELHRINTNSVSTREVSIAASTFDRQIYHNKMEPSVSLFATSNIARTSNTLPSVGFHSKCGSKITLDKRETLDTMPSKTDKETMASTPLPSSSISVAPPSFESGKIKLNASHASSQTTESMIFQKSKVSMTGYPSTRTTQTYGHSSRNVSRSSSVNVIKPTPRMTLSSAPGLHMTQPVFSLATLPEPTVRRASYQTTSSSITLSSPLSPKSSSSTTPSITLPLLPKLLSSPPFSSASTSLLTLSSSSSSSSSLSPSLSMTSESLSRQPSETSAKQEMSTQRSDTSSLPSVLIFASLSIQSSKSVSMSTLYLSATSTPSVPINLSPTETLTTLVPTPTRTSLLSSSFISSSSSFQEIFVPQNELSSAMSSRSLVSSASTTLHEDASFMYSMTHLSSSSLHKPLNSTSIAPTSPLRTTSLSSSTTPHNYSIFTKESVMGEISDSLSSVTSLSALSAISEPTPSLTEYSYVVSSSHFSSMTLLNQTTPTKSQVFVPSPPSPSSSPPPPPPRPSQSLSSSQPLTSQSSQSLSSSPSLPSSSRPLSGSPSSNRSFEWQSMLQETPMSKRLPLSTQNKTTESQVQNKSTIALQHPIPPLSLSASFAPSSTSSPSPSPLSTLPLISHFLSSSFKSLLSAPSSSVFISSSPKSPKLLTPVSTLLKSSLTSLSLPSATSTVSVLLSSSQSFTSLTPVSSLLAQSSSTFLPSTPLSSSLMPSSPLLSSTSFASPLKITTSSQSSLMISSPLSLSPGSSSFVSSSPSSLSTPSLSPMSSSLSSTSPVSFLVSSSPSLSYLLISSPLSLSPGSSSFVSSSPSSLSTPSLSSLMSSSLSSTSPVSFLVSSSPSLSSLLISSPLSLSPGSSSFMSSSPSSLSTPSLSSPMSSSTSPVSFLVSSSPSLSSLLISSPLSLSPGSSSFMSSSPSSLSKPSLSSPMSSSTSPVSFLVSSSSSSSSSLSSTSPLSSSLVLSSSLSSTSSVSFLLVSSSSLATPSLSSSLMLSSLSSSSISSSLIPSPLLSSLSSFLLPSSSLPSLTIIKSVSLMASSSMSPSLMSSSLPLSLSPTPSAVVSTTNLRLLPKNDTSAKTILPSKTFLVKQPSSPPPSKEPYIKEIFLAVFDGNCLDITSRESFKSTFIDTISSLIGLENDAIDILDIRCGSVEVLFSIIHKQTSKIAEVFDRLVKEERMNIVFNGKTYRAISITSLHPTTTRPTALSPSFINPTIYILTAQMNERRLVKILFVLFVSIFGALTLFGIVVCIARICGRRRYARLRLKSSTLSSRGTNQIYKNELELIRMSPLHRYADYYGGTNQEPPKEESDDEDNINNRTALLNMLRNGEIASRRGKIMVKDDDSYSSIAFY